MKKIISVLIAVFLLSAPLTAYAEERTLIRIDMKHDPEKTHYLIGEEIDLTDAYIELTYSDGVKEDVKITADMISGFDSSVPGPQVITVRYMKTSTSFSVWIGDGAQTDEQGGTRAEIDTSPARRDPWDERMEPDVVFISVSVGVCVLICAVLIFTVLRKDKK